MKDKVNEALEEREKILAPHFISNEENERLKKIQEQRLKESNGRITEIKDLVQFSIIFQGQEIELCNDFVNETHHPILHLKEKESFNSTVIEITNIDTDDNKIFNQDILIRAKVDDKIFDCSFGNQGYSFKNREHYDDRFENLGFTTKSFYRFFKFNKSKFNNITFGVKKNKVVLKKGSIINK